MNFNKSPLEKPQVGNNENSNENIDKDIEAQKQELEKNLVEAKSAMDSIGGEEGLEKAKKELGEDKMKNVLSRFLEKTKKAREITLNLAKVLAVPAIAAGLSYLVYNNLGGNPDITQQHDAVAYWIGIGGVAIMSEILVLLKMNPDYD